MKDSDANKLEFVRDYPVGLARLWQAVTDPAEIVKWFGPEGVDIVTCEMDFTARGPWSCVMVGRESKNRFKVTGEVTKVSVPSNGTGSVSFTWGWHDDADGRGDESHVTLDVTEIASGARLTLIHRALADMETTQSHSKGWLSTLGKLDQILAP
ncbi:MAG: SRPBCC family protein [Pseudooceanicola sp.]